MKKTRGGNRNLQILADGSGGLKSKGGRSERKKRRNTTKGSMCAKNATKEKKCWGCQTRDRIRRRRGGERVDRIGKMQRRKGSGNISTKNSFPEGGRVTRETRQRAGESSLRQTKGYFKGRGKPHKE